MLLDTAAALLADAASLDIPVWLGAAAVGLLFTIFAWLGNRAVKAIDDKLIEHDSRLTGEAKARHELAGTVQQHETDIALVKQRIEGL